MPSIADNVNAYETGCQPFEPDVNRGKWSSKWSFYLAAISHGFAMWHMYLDYFVSYGGVFFLIPYVISMFLFIVPIVFIQSCLGQFSSTGYISVFRIAPLFKGIGYITVTLNVSCVVIYSVYSAYPLVYFLLSLASSYPWLTCSNQWNSPNCTEVVQNGEYQVKVWLQGNHKNYKFWSTNEYYDKEILNDVKSDITKISSYILAATFLVWVLTAIVLLNGVKSFGKAILITGSVPLVLLIAFVIRASFLSNASKVYAKMFLPDVIPLSDFNFWVQTSTLIVLSLGAGWGSLLTLASYNDFKANAARYAVSICGCHILITMLSAMFTYLVHEGAKGRLIFQSYYLFDYHVKYLFVPYPYFFETLEASRVWMTLFYMMLFLVQFNIVVIQVFAILTAFFDEFKILRKNKRIVTMGSCGVLFAASIIFTTNNMHDFFEFLSRYAALTRTGICLLELFVVLWIYGRLRFQRDIQFMLSQRIASWIFFVIRFVTPLFMVYLMYILIMLVTTFSDLEVPAWCRVITYLMKVVPWIIVPATIVFKLLTTTGPLLLRFKRLIRPTDWYPADPRNRQKYQDVLDAADMSQQLIEINCDLEEDFYDY